jgi:hypothetical protein
MTTQFKERLLGELKANVAEAPARRRPGRKPMFAAIGALVGAAVVVAVPSLMAGSASAYEITHHGDKVTVEFTELNHPDALAAALNEHGVKTVVRHHPVTDQGWVCRIRGLHHDPDQPPHVYRLPGQLTGFSFRVSDLDGGPLVIHVNSQGQGVITDRHLDLRCHFED